MLYHITGLCPRTDIELGRCGFCIQLFPDWRYAVKKATITQGQINTAIKRCHRAWLDGCGYGQMFDPEQDPMAAWEERHLGKKSKLGPNATPLYGENEIRVLWGEWGPEHITVPGNACGLDIDSGPMSPRGGRVLCPHNIDSFGQVILILTVFTTIADFVMSYKETD